MIKHYPYDPVNLNLDHYLKKYDNFLSDEECKNIIEEIEKEKWTKHAFYNVGEKGLDTHPFELDNLFDPYSKKKCSTLINERIKNVLMQYIGDLKFSWFDMYNDYSPVRYNRYSEGTAMAPHCDHIYTLFTKDDVMRGIPVLSLIGALNDDYEGGEFIMWQKNVIPIPKGSVIIFPSNFLYPHHVEFITKGIRHTFVSWAW